MRNAHLGICGFAKNPFIRRALPRTVFLKIYKNWHNNPVHNLKAWMKNGTF